jgi:PAT family beta-lactamase induction signal transducer AmpG
MLPNLLATRRGRLAAFFLLYITEGIPLGFAATVVATQLRRMGVGPEAIGAFVATFYLPWAFKWAFGPVIDVFRSRRFGHRRGWILLTQLLMAGTLLSLVAVPLPQGLPLFTAVLMVHNTFGAMQDVAIDALAVNSLGEDERGLANGLMFAGASLGQAIGGSGVLLLIGVAGFSSGFVMVALAILAVTTFVVLPMKEALVEQVSGATETARAGWTQALGEMRSFALASFRSFLGSRAAFAGVFFALWPAGAMSLSLSLQTTLAVDLGMADDAVATLSLLGTLSSGVAMVIGGLISDRVGQRRALFVYILLMSLPVLWMSWALQQAGYVMPRPGGSAPIPALISTLWATTLAFNVAMGLMYGTRSAVFMDITNPAVAATQFTAYMALMNLAIAFSATWQGVAIEALGFPMTMLFDALIGPLGLVLLPALRRKVGVGVCDPVAEGRARWSARVLGLLCLGFVVWWQLHDRSGRAAGLVNTLFTLVFVASALFLYAGTLLQPLSAAGQRLSRLLALALLLVYARRFVPALPTEALASTASFVISAVAALAGLWLLRLGTRPWPGLVEAAPG